MKHLTTLFSIAVFSSAGALAEAPAVLSVLPEGEMVKGAITVVVPPPELDKYVAKVEEAARKNPEWFDEHSKKTPPGVPIAWDERTGLTKEEYDSYLELWSKREYRAIEAVILQLKQGADKMWKITAAGGANPISTLKYDPAKDVFVSPNGTLSRLEDIKADKMSILGEWTGSEWKYEEENSLGKTKENFAIGKTADGKFGLLVYRMQEVTSQGTRLYDKSVVVRFPMGEAGILKPGAP